MSWEICVSTVTTPPKMCRPRQYIYYRTNPSLTRGLSNAFTPHVPTKSGRRYLATSPRKRECNRTLEMID